VTAAGLRRFAAPPGAAAGRPAAAELPQRCELCAEPLADSHGHLVDLTDRAIACACRACYLLFTPGGAGGRYRAVPDRYRYLAGLPISAATWDRLGVPVGMAFFFHNSTQEQVVAFYPSPAGATESQLDLAAWNEFAAAAPEVTDLLPDVEALLVNRIREPAQPARFEGYAVPVDACYRLVALMRMHWRGFDGGEQAWQAIRDYLAELRGRSEPLVAGQRHG
jgi:hypothetical protein